MVAGRKFFMLLFLIFHSRNGDFKLTLDKNSHNKKWDHFKVKLAYRVKMHELHLCIPLNPSVSF